MKSFRLKIVVTVLAFSFGLASVWAIGGFSYLASLFVREIVVSEVSAQTNQVLPELNSSKNESVNTPKLTYPFSDYPVTEIYKGKTAPFKLSRHDRLFYEGRYKLIENSEPDFAGHYIVASWSCGMWCQNSDIIDAKTGKFYGWNGILSPCFPRLDTDFPCNEDFSNVEYRVDSKLIIFFGSLDYGKDRGFHYYKFEKGRLIHLKSVLVKEQRSTSEIMLDKSEENGQ
jgi:hypothetical protein